jgi:ribose transport system substrate-binding protein
MLQGRKFKSGVLTGKNNKTLYIPIPLIDNTNVEQIYAKVKDQPGYFSVSTEVTPEQAAAYFE